MIDGRVRTSQLLRRRRIDALQDKAARVAPNKQGREGLQHGRGWQLEQLQLKVEGWR